MVDPVNTSSQVPPANIQNTAATDQEETVQRQSEEQQQTVQQTVSQDSVTISSETSATEENATATTIQNNEQAQQVASRVVNLFQAQPELAATAQGGQLTAEKADAYLQANIGG